MTSVDDQEYDQQPPGVSVIIPTHDGRASLQSVVRSLLLQGDGPLEIVVVMDGNSAATREAVAQFQDPRIVLYEQPRSGPAAARNLGLSMARYRWVAFADDDDVPRNNWLQTWRNNIHADTLAVTAWAAYHRASSPVQVRACSLSLADPTIAASTILAGTFVVRRDLLSAIGGYDANLRAAENQDLGLRLCDHIESNQIHGKVTQVKDVIIDVHVEDTASRVTRYGPAHSDAAKVFLYRYNNRLKDDPQHESALLRIIARGERLAGNYSSARGYALRACRLTPRNTANWRSLLISTFPRTAVRAINANNRLISLWNKPS